MAYLDDYLDPHLSAVGAVSMDDETVALATAPTDNNLLGPAYCDISPNPDNLVLDFNDPLLYHTPSFTSSTMAEHPSAHLSDDLSPSSFIPTAPASTFPSPTSSQSSSHKPSSKSTHPAVHRPATSTIDEYDILGPNLTGKDAVHKRQRNTEAARRYRQRKVDRLSELEDALREMTAERDELRLKLARAEAEAQVLKGMVERK